MSKPIYHTWLGTKVPAERYNDPGVQTPEILPNIEYNRITDRWITAVKKPKKKYFLRDKNNIRGVICNIAYATEPYMFDVLLLGVFDEAVRRLTRNSEQKDCKFLVMLTVDLIYILKPDMINPFVDSIIARKCYHINIGEFNVSYYLAKKLIDLPYEELLAYSINTTAVVYMLIHNGMSPHDYIRDKQMSYYNMVIRYDIKTVLCILNDYKHSAYRYRLTRKNCVDLANHYKFLTSYAAYEIKRMEDGEKTRNLVIEKLIELGNTAPDDDLM